MSTICNDIQHGAQLQGLCKRYGDAVAVHDVSLEVLRGEFLTLLGSSGSGKTTLLMILAGFTRPDAGRVLIDGLDMAGIPPFRRNLGFVFQNYALFPHMSVSENVAYPLRARRMRSAEVRAAVGEALDIVRLQGLGNRRPGELSGGQQQRVALARALVYRPPLLLMDEPLSALDKNLRTHMQLELKHIQEQLGLTVLYVTHDQEEALTMSSRIAVMDSGGLVQVGTPPDIYDAPVNRFIAEFVGETNLFKARLDPTDAGEVVLDGLPGRRFKARPAGRDSMRPGQEVHLAVRPERITFFNGSGQGGHGPGGDGPDGDAAGNHALTGVIRDAVYLGGVTKYLVKPLCAPVTESGLVCVKVSNRCDRQRHAPGDEVRFGWNEMDANIV